MKNLNEIKKILEISSNKKFSEKKLLEEFNWDSLAMINLITLANKNKTNDNVINEKNHIRE